jgi:uncharacterized protein YggE
MIRTGTRDREMGGITVRGSGLARRTPDQATVTVSVERQGVTAGDAQQSASARMRAILVAIRETGVTDEDVATSQVSLNPSWDYSGSTPRMTGYTASQGVTVRVRRLDDLGTVIDRAVGAGATNVSEVTLSVADPKAALDEARELAIRDAQRKAEAIAAVAGVTLGAPIQIIESVSAPGPRPMMRAKAEMALAADMPISVGTSELTAEVEMTFAILAGS